MSRMSDAIEESDLEDHVRAVKRRKEIIEDMRKERVIYEGQKLVITCKEFEDGLQICAYPSDGDYRRTTGALSFFPWNKDA